MACDTHSLCSWDADRGWRAEASSQGNPADTKRVLSRMGSRASSWTLTPGKKSWMKVFLLESFSHEKTCRNLGIWSAGIFNDSDAASSKFRNTTTAQSVPEQKVPIDQSCPFWASDLESAISHPKKKPRKSGKKEPNRNYCTTLNEQTGRWRNVNNRVTKGCPHINFNYKNSIGNN